MRRVLRRDRRLLLVGCGLAAIMVGAQAIGPHGTPFNAVLGVGLAFWIPFSFARLGQIRSRRRSS